MGTSPRGEPLTVARESWHGSTDDGRERRFHRNQRRDTTFRRLLGVADAVALLLSLVLSAVLFGEDSLSGWALLAPLPFIGVAKAIGLYDRDEHLLHKTTLEEVPKLFALSTFAALILFLSIDALIEGQLGQRQILGTWALLFGLAVVLRSLARFSGRKLTQPERCLLVGSDIRERELRDAIELSSASHATVVGQLPATRYLTAGDAGEMRALPERMLDELEVDRVVVAPGSHDEDVLMFAIRELKDAAVKVSLLPDTSRMAGSSVELDHLGGFTLLGMRGFEITRSSRVIKRSFDLLIASFVTLVSLPLAAVVAVAIRLDSPGPVFFRQERIGRDGKRFQMLKFRSMADGSEAERPGLAHLSTVPPGLFKIDDDPRVTRVGRWIRRTHVDELPQMLNVLFGQMSIVGPRPLVPEEDLLIQGRYRRRLDVRPGITGLWQVLGSARVPIEEMVKLDYLYVANWSLWRDIALILRTLPPAVRRRGL